ncbi:MAG: hypothetical protein ACRDKJ_13820 [Actinomycetota bacterium]
MRKGLAALFVAFGLAGIFAVTPAASADPLISYDLEGTIDDEPPSPGGPLACVNPHIEVFDNVLLEDPICI